MPTLHRRLLRLAGPAALAMCLQLAACTADTSTAPASSPATKPTPAAVEPITPATKPVAFDSTTMTIKGQTFTMDLALNNEQNERGLMYRDFMPADHGMLFVMPYADTWSFWMHDTHIPLDIIFLDKRGTVMEIHKRAAMDETGKGPVAPALYIIELNLGVSDKIGLKPGDTVEIPKKYVKN